MLIGILSEDTSDTNSLKEIVNKILSQYSIVPEFISVEAHGQIVSKIDTANKLFFGTTPVCDMAIYLNDFDTYPERCVKVRRLAASFISKNPSVKIVVGCPKPNFEQWLIIEENAVKSFLGLRSSNPIPHNSIRDPKARLQKIIDENGDITMSYTENYVEIAKQLNFDVLCERDNTFKRFHDEFSDNIR